MTNNRSSTTTSSSAPPVMMMPVLPPQPQQQHQQAAHHQQMVMVPVVPMPAPQQQLSTNGVHAQPVHQPMMMVPVQPIHTTTSSSLPATTVTSSGSHSEISGTGSTPSHSSSVPMTMIPQPAASMVLPSGPQQQQQMVMMTPSSSVPSIPAAGPTTPILPAGTASPSMINNVGNIHGGAPAHFKALRESAAQIDVSDVQKDNGPKQLIINFISLDTSEQDLTDLFTPIGTLDSVRVIVDRNNKNRSKGYAFVYFVSSDDAVKAIKQLQGTLLKGKHIKVGFAIPQRPSPTQLARQAMILSKEHHDQTLAQRQQAPSVPSSSIPHPMSMPAPHPALVASRVGHTPMQPTVATATPMMLVPVAPAPLPTHSNSGSIWTDSTGSQASEQ